MSIENMFGDLDKIDILAEKPETKEVLMVLVCNGFIDGSPETQKALLNKCPAWAEDYGVKLEIEIGGKQVRIVES